MATATLSTAAQDRIEAIRGRLNASRKRSGALFNDFRASAQQDGSALPGIDEVIATIRGKVAVTGNSVSLDEASPNPGLPMMAGATSKQK
jgi:hypothetical protein